MKNPGFIFFGLRHILNDPLSHCPSLTIKTIHNLPFSGNRKHFIRKLKKSFILAKGHINNKTSQPGAYGDTERTARTLGVIDGRIIVDILKGNNRSGGAASIAGIAGDSLGAFHNDKPAFFVFPEFLRGSNGSLTRFCQNTAIV